MRFPEAQYEIALELIDSAENELGTLSRGQLTDLLADNTDWSLAKCRHFIDYHRPALARKG
jgi:hypothetical protein